MYNKKIDPELVRKRATEIAEQSYDWVAPRAEKAWQDTVKIAGPALESATDKAREGIDLAHEKIVDDVIPRVEAAVRSASEAAQKEGTMSERAVAITSATKSALKDTPKKKRCPRFKKGLGFLTLGAAFAAVGYFLWRRTQPVEDPWAEEYWEDVEAETAPVTDQTDTENS